ncbi:polysaccharide biosynthesis tyrosine autokinase [Nocardioides sp. GXQ0305]|uniref:polysaccharide biosynthesis tyrosine autokinase n=1 Tax=Nocardioides sp. GXQ0305 TaxID=3423912 RepID=UPI003D7E7015
MTEDVAVAPDRLGLRDYARVLRRRWRSLTLVVVVCVGLALAYSLAATPLYIASSDVLLEPTAAEMEAATGATIDAEEVATQTEVVTSLPVARLVQQRLGMSSTPDLSEVVTVQAVGTSRILRITAQDADPERAAETANLVATSYLQFREQDSVGSYDQARDRLAEEQAEIEARLAEVNTLLAQGSGQQLELQLEKRTLLNSLTQIDTQTTALTESLTTAASGGRLLRTAEVPDDPISPQTLLNLILGTLVGLVLGVGAALLRDRLDDVVHEETAVRQALDAVVLGRVPQWPERAYRDRLVTLLDPQSPASEEYQRLGVNMRFMLATLTKDDGALVLLTSGQEGEGKTVTSCNLAVAAARLGLNVVLVDGDLRRASCALRFGLGDPPGLSDLLIEQGAEASRYLVDVGVENLSFLPAGTSAPDPVALLSSPRMELLLRELTARADLVVIDSPPLLTGADTLELATHSDMVIVVTRERVSRRRQLVAVRESLRHVTVRSVGLVYNGIGDSTRGYGYRRRARPALEPEPGPAPSEARTPEASGTGGR